MTASESVSSSSARERPSSPARKPFSLKKWFLGAFRRYVPRSIEGAVWSLLVKARPWLWRVSSLIPCGILRRLPGSSRSFGPPRGLAHTAELAAGLRLSKVLHPERRFSFAPEASAVFPPVGAFVGARESGSPAVKIAVLENARTYGAKGAIVDQSDQFITEFSVEHARAHSPETALRHSLFTRWKLPTARVLPGMAASLLTPGSDNYYHWLYDVLPRLALLKEAGIDSSSMDWWIVPRDLAPFHEQTLAMVGIDEAHRVPCGNGEGLEAERLVCFTPAMCSGSPPAWVIGFLRSMRDQHARLPAGFEGPLKIYLTRRRAPYRRVLNEDAVVKHLEARGFVALAGEDFDVREQMALFQAAEIIVAPHGAGLANIAFCQPGARVVELLPAGYMNRIYAETSLEAQLRYCCVIDVSQALSDVGNLAADINVSIDDLDRALTCG